MISLLVPASNDDLLGDSTEQGVRGVRIKDIKGVPK